MRLAETYIAAINRTALPSNDLTQTALRHWENN